MKDLVIYYSWSGNTRKMAQIIGEKTGADLFELTLAKPYSTTYAVCVAQAGKEIFTHKSRPVVELPDDIASYDRIFLGSPVWWYGWSLPMLQCLKKLNLAAKVVMPFCTHGGGGGANLAKDLKKWQPQANIKESLIVLKDGGEELATQIERWLSLYANVSL